MSSRIEMDLDDEEVTRPMVRWPHGAPTPPAFKRILLGPPLTPPSGDQPGRMDRLADEVASLLLAIPPLEHALEGQDEDRAMRVAVRTLAEVADGLLDAVGAHTPAVAGRLRAHGVSVLDHLARVQACCARLLSAYEELVEQRRLGAPNWSLLRSRLDAALDPLLLELVTPGHAEVVHAIASCKPPAAGPMRTLARALERLQGAVSWLVAHLRASQNVAEDPGGARAARGRG